MSENMTTSFASIVLRITDTSLLTDCLFFGGK